MVSSLTAAGAEATAASLLEGAFDFLLKPTGTDPKENLLNLRSALEEKIDAFRQSRPPGKRSAESPRPSSGRLWSRKTKPQIVVIGCSTGGPEALREILPELPPELPVPVLVAQHMPAQFTGPLAARLNAISRIRVIEADNGMEVAPGTVMIAPGGRQTAIHRRNNQFVIATSDDPPEHGCRPSVDYLLRSVVENYGETALAIILTGMGRDGTEGCRLLKERGGSVWAQDEATSIVFGMPRSVQSAGLADAVVSLGDVAREVIRNCR